MNNDESGKGQDAMAYVSSDAPVQLQHMAVAEDGILRWMSGRKAENCELYAMPDFGPAPPLWTAPSARAMAADRTLQHLGYTWNGGTLWRPPLGAAPKFMQDTLDRVNAAAGLKPLPGETACNFRNRILAQGDVAATSDSSLETSEDEARPYMSAMASLQAAYEATAGVRAALDKLGQTVGAGEIVDADYWAGDEEAISKALVALDQIATDFDRYEQGLPVDVPGVHEKLAGVLRQMLADQRSALAQGQPAEMSAAARDVLAERRRQQEVEGWTPEHDDMHRNGALAQAAACYALYELGVPGFSRLPNIGPIWPFAWTWLKPSTHRENLKKAGALIVAEMERLDRAAEKGGAA